jgi:hypothetical protein
MSEEEAEVMATIKREDIGYDTQWERDCVFCWTTITGDDDFGIITTSNGTHYLCMECRHDG